MGASTPIVAYPGSRPIAKVDTPISSRLSTSSFLRPMRSPKWPNTSPPNGRATKPMAKVASDWSVPIVGSEAGKKTEGKTTAAATP